MLISFCHNKPQSSELLSAFEDFMRPSSVHVHPLCQRPQGRVLHVARGHVVAQLLHVLGHYVEGDGHKALRAHPGH